jgi:hypothetical protein
VLGAAGNGAIFGGIWRRQWRQGGEAAGLESHGRGRGTKFYSQFLYTNHGESLVFAATET